MLQNRTVIESYLIPKYSIEKITLILIPKRYYLTNNIDWRTESCLLSAAFFKSILRGSVPYSKYDVDYARNELSLMSNDNLLPGILFNSDM